MGLNSKTQDRAPEHVAGPTELGVCMAMSVELVLGSVKDVLESPVLKQALMDDLEAHLVLYGLKPVDLKPAVVRGVRVRRG